MTTKQFYLLLLLFVSLFVGMMMLFLWREVRNKLQESNGLLFLGLAALSWSVVGAYKYYDPEIPPLVHAINDRILSSFSNLFLLASLPYFRVWEKRFAIFSNPEKWIIRVFIFFTVITALFTVIERSFDGELGSVLIILLDMLISVTVLSAVLYGIWRSIHYFWTQKLIIGAVFIVFLIFVLSQFFLPLVSVFPEVLRNYYYFGLLGLILGIIAFATTTLVYFTLLNYEFNHAAVTEKNIVSKEKNEEISRSINGIQIGYDVSRKMYYISIHFSDEEGAINVDTIELKKPLKPYLHWLVFCVAKQANARLNHSDMPTTKFRMVELWNKYSNTMIKQDDLFLNDYGNFELAIPKENIEIKTIPFLTSRFAVRQIFKGFSSCFDQENFEYLRQLDQDYDRFWKS
jgi:hypothetical protein